MAKRSKRIVLERHSDPAIEIECALTMQRKQFVTFLELPEVDRAYWEARIATLDALLERFS